GQSFFARAVQLRCFNAVVANADYLHAVPGWLSEASVWLEDALPSHWDPNRNHYATLLPTVAGYDPNMEVVMACISGAIRATDARLLSTAANIRHVWADQGSTHVYPINTADRRRGIGPVIGRYPDDAFRPDSESGTAGGLPWTQCTCNLAELYYRVAADV